MGLLAVASMISGAGQGLGRGLDQLQTTALQSYLADEKAKADDLRQSKLMDFELKKQEADHAFKSKDTDRHLQSQTMRDVIKGSEETERFREDQETKNKHAVMGAWQKTDEHRETMEAYRERLKADEAHWSRLEKAEKIHADERLDAIRRLGAKGGSAGAKIEKEELRDYVTGLNATLKELNAAYLLGKTPALKTQIDAVTLRLERANTKYEKLLDIAEPAPAGGTGVGLDVPDKYKDKSPRAGGATPATASPAAPPPAAEPAYKYTPPPPDAGGVPQAGPGAPVPQSDLGGAFMHNPAPAAPPVTNPPPVTNVPPSRFGPGGAFQNETRMDKIEAMQSANSALNGPLTSVPPQSAVPPTGVMGSVTENVENTGIQPSPAPAAPPVAPPVTSPAPTTPKQGAPQRDAKAAPKPAWPILTERMSKEDKIKLANIRKDFIDNGLPMKRVEEQVFNVLKPYYMRSDDLPIDQLPSDVHELVVTLLGKHAKRQGNG